MLKKFGLAGVIFVLVFLLLNSVVFAAPTDLAVRFLNKAKDAVEKNDIEKAYNYVNTALVMSYEDVDENDKVHQNIIAFAQSVYIKKLQSLIENYSNGEDELELVEIKMNLEKYPLLMTEEISNVINKLSEIALSSIGNDVETDGSKEKLKDFEVRLKELKDEHDVLAESQSEFKAFEDVVTENIENTTRSANIIAFAIISVSAIILIIIVLIVVICKKGFSQQHMQQEQYIQAFKMMASSQNGNQNILGGVTDIYGSHSKLKIAGSSSLMPKDIPNISFVESDEKEIKTLAIKCEELGCKIDSATGRKNNSKNVSEIVYKLSLQMGLSSELAMVYFCAAMVYDAGFLGIDPDLLSSSIMTKEEKEALKVHVSLATGYLKFVPKKYKEIFEDAVMKHHENMDGSGYPNGLKDNEIPLIARLIHVAESYISISSRRSYRAPIDKETAVGKLKAEPGAYDKNIVEALDQIV